VASFDAAPTVVLNVNAGAGGERELDVSVAPKVLDVRVGLDSSVASTKDGETTRTEEQTEA
jgi:hypothetical protein